MRKRAGERVGVVVIFVVVVTIAAATATCCWTLASDLYLPGYNNDESHLLSAAVKRFQCGLVLNQA